MSFCSGETAFQSYKGFFFLFRATFIPNLKFLAYVMARGQKLPTHLDVL